MPFPTRFCPWCLGRNRVVGIDPRLAEYRRSEGLLGSRCLYMEQLDSTNDLLVRLGEQGAPEGLLVLTEEQTAGRGRLGRRWSAPPGCCLLFSLLFRPPAPFVNTAAQVTMLCGIALVEAARQAAGVSAWLKWPNDLIVERETQWFKLAGMLSEVGWQGPQPAFLVVGIGLNVNVLALQLPELSPHATSLLVETGQPCDRVAFLEAFLSHADALYQRLRMGEDLLPLWRARLAWFNRVVRVQTPTEIITGVAQDVDPSGALIVRLEDGVLRRFSAGDVSVRL